MQSRNSQSSIARASRVLGKKRKARERGKGVRGRKWGCGRERRGRNEGARGLTFRSRALIIVRRRCAKRSAFFGGFGLCFSVAAPISRGRGI